MTNTHNQLNLDRTIPPAEIDQINEHSRRYAFVHIASGNTQILLPEPSTSILALGLYSISEPREPLQRQEVRTGGDIINLRTTHIIGEALLANNEIGLDLPDSGATSESITEISDSVMTKLGKPAFLYQDGQRVTTEQSWGGYLFSRTPSGAYKAGLYISQNLLLSVGAGLQNISLEKKDYWTDYMRQAPASLVRQAKIIDTQASNKELFKALKTRVASRLIANGIKQALETMKDQITTEITSVPIPETMDLVRSGEVVEVEFAKVA
jgi:hypothetical protein